MKFIEQSDEKDCGPACIAMISKFYGKKTSIEKIREYAGTDLYGTNISGMIKAGEAIGFDVEAFEIEYFKELYYLKKPIIAHILNDKGFNHFVIIKKITSKNFFITDPARGHYKISKEEFQKQFTNIIITFKKKETFTKTPNYPSTVKFFLNIFKKNQLTIWIILLTSIFINIIGIIGAFYFKYLVDEIIPSTFIENLHNFSIAILMLYIISLLISFIRYQLVLNMGLKINKYLMLNYYKHILHLPMRFFETRKEGEILSRFRDTEKIREAFSSVTVTLFMDLIMIVIGSVILLMQNKNLFLIVLTLVPIYIALAIFFKKPFEKYNRQEMEKNADLSSSFIEGIRGIDTIKSYNAEQKFFHKTNTIFDMLLSNIFKLGTYMNMQLSLKEFMTLTSTLVILWFGSIQVMNDTITLGELLTFNALVVYYIDPVERLIDSQSVIQSAIVSTRRVLEVTDLNKESIKNKMPKFDKNIEFHQVNFYYGHREKVLKDIDFTIEKGENIALVGQSGSGKSTIVKLLLQYYMPQKGNIYIDGEPLSSLNRDKWRNDISYVSQNNFIFYGSVLENLILNDDTSYSMEEIIKACKAAEIHDFIMDLPFKYNTILETNGENLSGGEIQRISLARAFLKKSKILILDEPTSALDFSTESKIQNYIESFETTLIVISHRLGLVSHFDKIITFNKGEIVETGTHEQLMNNKKNYYNLWNTQNN
ncbi:peptidase domain-containing ABC transporter [Staphylococcus arlettae]|uniref:peptidase domain-containing ABC transporter n=1 Tax=Staphylococcus arlettae TaxID=29378 RepID=UPI0021CE135B|nr:peptidase domain-containing ABC transporter [Staphylococcus arlettae]UXU51192.1 peptidase domain-containing ABC transporter [Staphylococcus arlettae]